MEEGKPGPQYPGVECPGEHWPTEAEREQVRAVARAALPEGKPQPPTREESWWAGPDGDGYTRAFVLEPDELDRMWKLKYGVSRTDLCAVHVHGTGRRILEVGCGAGNQLALLRGLGFRAAEGVDINALAVERAVARGCKAQVASARALPFPDCAFELVFTCGVLSHLADAELPAALAELARVAATRVWLTEYRGDPHAGAGLLWARDHAEAFLAHAPGAWRVANCWRLNARAELSEFPAEFRGILEAGSHLETVLLERW